MPTFNRRKADTTIHPAQTKYYVLARTTRAGNVTYQVHGRAVHFLTEELGYDDGDQLPWGLVAPLRRIRDLFTLDEGRPRPTDPDEHDVSHTVSMGKLNGSTMERLVEYLRSHPDVSVTDEGFAATFRAGDASSLRAITRTGYTPDRPPSDGSTGNRSLDGIARKYFASGTEPDVPWDGEPASSYVTIEDREGTVYEFPKLEERFPEGERLRLSRDLYERWGREIGDSEANSRRYEPGEEGFPNRWIGQREDSPEPSLEDALSPRAFFYRTLAGRSHFAPGTEAEEAFAEACEYPLEVYRANFPVAVDPRDLQTAYVTVEESTRPWEDFQVPPRWLEAYEDSGGLPPLRRVSLPADVDPDVRRLFERRGPGGSEPQWFDDAVELLEVARDSRCLDLLVAADDAEFDVVEVTIRADGTVDLEVQLGDATLVLGIGADGDGDGSLTVSALGTHRIRSVGPSLTGWEVPTVASPSGRHAALGEQARWFERVAAVVDIVGGSGAQRPDIDILDLFDSTSG